MSNPGESSGGAGPPLGKRRAKKLAYSMVANLLNQTFHRADVVWGRLDVGEAEALLIHEGLMEIARMCQKRSRGEWVPYTGTVEGELPDEPDVDLHGPVP